MQLEQEQQRVKFEARRALLSERRKNKINQKLAEALVEDNIKKVDQ